jgi:hypothetical protein
MCTEAESMTANCPYCGRDIYIHNHRFRLHETLDKVWCPLSNQRTPVSGDSVDAHAERAELLADLAFQVQDADPAAVWTYLTCLSDAELQTLLMFALAALPIDKTVHDMWGWVSQLPAAQLRAV